VLATSLDPLLFFSITGSSELPEFAALAAALAALHC
jgi:hypothetical protein